MPLHERLLKECLFTYREANRHAVSEPRVVAGQAILKFAIENEVDIILALALLLVNILSRLYEEDQAFIEKILESRALQACKDEVISLDLVHQMVDL